MRRVASATSPAVAAVLSLTLLVPASGAELRAQATSWPAGAPESNATRAGRATRDGVAGQDDAARTARVVTADAAARLERSATLHLREVRLAAALDAFARATGVPVGYGEAVLESAARVTIAARARPAADVLREVLAGSGLQAVLAPDGGGLLIRPLPPTRSAPRAPARLGSVSGVVRDSAQGSPLVGATVQVEGTAIRAITNTSGRYVIANVPEGTHRITVRRLGYAPATQSIEVGGGPVVLDVALAAVSTRLEEVITTATGDQRRVELGTAIASIGADSIVATAPVMNMSDLLSGRAANVQLLAGSGVTGAGGRFRIRGVSSVLLDNDPIVYVDGVRVEAGAPNYDGIGDISATLGGQRVSRLNDLNPEDIESIEVVKGPSAATLYGTNAANGVILVRTKRGQAGDARWTVNLEAGRIDQPAEFPNSYHLWGRNPATGAAAQCFLNTVASGACAADSLTRYSPLNDPGRTPFGTGDRSQFGVQVSGGSDVARYFASAELENETGALRLPEVERERISAERGGASVPGAQRHPNSLRKLSLRGNLATTLSPSLELGLNAGYVSSRTRLPFDGTFQNGIMLNALQGRGYRDAQDGYLFFRPGDLFAQEYYQDATRFIGGSNMSWRPQPWLQVRGTAGLDFTARTNDLLQRRDQGPALANWREGRRGIERANIFHYTGDLGATATFQLTPSLTSRTTAGAQYYRDLLRATNAGALVLGPASETINGAGTSYQAEVTTEAVTFGSFVEQTFGVNDRLFLTAAVRADGNSAFGENFDTAYYPKGSVSWLASQESFFPTIPTLSSLRLRVAYGASGVQPGALAALRYYTGFTATAGGTNVSGVSLAALGNADLKPERSAELETGLDAVFGDGRVSLELTYYDKESRDALVNRPLAPSLGGGSRLENIGAVRNRGVEMLATVRVLETSSLSWDVTVAGSRNDNEVLRLDPGARPTGVLRDLPGYPIAGIWVRPILSVTDANDNGAIDPSEVVLGDTAVFMGSSIPTREASLNTTLGVLGGRLRLGAQLDYRGGYKKLNATELNRCFSGSCRGRSDESASIEERARAAIASGFTYAGFAEDASFLRFRELSLSYTLPPRFADALRARSTVVTLAGRNLGIITDYSGIDPEPATRLNNGEQTRDYPVVPPARYWIARVTVGF